MRLQRTFGRAANIFSGITELYHRAYLHAHARERIVCRCRCDDDDDDDDASILQAVMSRDRNSALAASSPDMVSSSSAGMLLHIFLVGLVGDASAHARLCAMHLHQIICVTARGRAPMRAFGMHGCSALRGLRGRAPPDIIRMISMYDPALALLVWACAAVMWPTTCSLLSIPLSRTQRIVCS